MVANTYRNSLSATTAAAGGGGGMLALQNSTAAQLKCPRCDSTNTKFCYYNNYSLAQPRHFCKACKRYWTRGGTLRDVPFGGGCRKYKRHKKPQSAIAAALSSTPLLRRLANTLPPPASDLCSPIYGMPSSNLSNLFFPRFEETNQSGIGPHLVDYLHQSAEAGKSYQTSLPSYDDLSMGLCEELSLIKDNPMESIYSFNGSGSAAAESAYFYGWPESCSSMVRLP